MKKWYTEIIESDDKNKILKNWIILKKIIVWKKVEVYSIKENNRKKQMLKIINMERGKTYDD